MLFGSEGGAQGDSGRGGSVIIHRTSRSGNNDDVGGGDPELVSQNLGGEDRFGLGIVEAAIGQSRGNTSTDCPRHDHPDHCQDEHQHPSLHYELRHPLHGFLLDRGTTLTNRRSLNVVTYRGQLISVKSRRQAGERTLRTQGEGGEATTAALGYHIQPF
jgi:hypothetical protein